MKEIQGNLFDHIGKADAICITTNGFVKSNGECVMGKGCAQEATKRWPGIALLLGDSIKADGNAVIPLISENETVILSFPVKSIRETFDGTNAVRHMTSKFKVGDSMPGWACKAKIDIIESSASCLARIATAHKWTNIILPRPGCGAGELNWAEVKEVLNKHLDDRFSSITF